MREVPFARENPAAVWPLPDVTLKRWTIGDSRADGQRRHAGVDLYAPRGSFVLAPEGGTIIAHQRFNGPNAVALLMQSDSGPVILLGEVEPASWEELGYGVGSRVEAGHPIARVGINPEGDQMLHFEMYTRGTRRNSQWMSGSPPPANLLNPMRYLRAAAANVDPVDPDHVDVDPVVPKDPAEQGSGIGIALLAALLIFGGLR